MNYSASHPPFSFRTLRTGLIDAKIDLDDDGAVILNGAVLRYTDGQRLGLTNVFWAGIVRNTDLKFQRVENFPSCLK